MAMNPRLLRPILSGDPDALRYIAAVQTADGQSLESGVKKAITDFIVGCKTDGIWTAIKASCILCGARTLSGALTPLVGAAPTSNNFVSGDYDRKDGLVGNASNKNLDTNRSNDADAQNDHHVALWVTTAGNDSVLVADRGFNATTGQTTLGWSTLLYATSRASGWDNLGTVDGSFTRANVGGNLFGISRSASASYTARAKGTTITFTKTSQAPAAGDIFLYSSSAGGFYSNARLAFYSIGSSLTLATLNSRVSTLISAIGAAI